MTCRQTGTPSLGVEISPLFQFIARVKIQNYDVERLRHYRDRIFEERFKKKDYEVSSFLKNLYPRQVLEDVFFFKDVLQTIEEEKYRNFFMLALMVASEKSSFIYRDGAVVKVMKTKPRIPSLRKAYRRVLSMMIKDVQTEVLKEVHGDVVLGDARQLTFLEDETVDAIITSPPYLNKIEYTQCYWPEYELFFPNKGHPSLRSYIGMRVKDVDYSSYYGDIPYAAKLYFEDMKKAFTEFVRVLKQGCNAVVVVGGGVFPDRVIETDVELASIAEEVGFTVERIVAVNRRVATARRVLKIGETRESILYLMKS
ncbi:MAG: hypothetical protein RMH74_01820 [Candidatus Caldarchaeum sp.]|nr:hypothetical protein [Candidatus Caldarchaeum sp.]